MSDIAFKVLIGNGYDDVLFKTIMLKGEKGDKGEAGGAEIDDSTISASKTWSSNKINSEISAKPSAFSQLSDVAISNISDGQMAVYNSATGKWKNQNVDASTLKYNSTKTIKAELDAKASSLTDLDDVSITNPQNEQGVIYDATTGKWENGDIAKFTNTASGSLVHITDGAENIPVKSLVAQIVAQQAGSGDPSPSNVRPIIGADSVTVTRTGKNLFSFEKAVLDSANANVYLTPDGYIRFVTNNNRIKYNIKTSNVVTFTATVASETPTSNAIRFIAYYTDGTNSVIASVTTTDTNDHIISGSSTSGKTIYGIQSAWTDGVVSYLKQAQLEISNAATDYEAYQGNTYTFAFGQTVYGGYFDNKGNLVVTHGYILVNGSENFDMGVASNFRYFDMSMVEPLNANAWETNIISNIFKKQGQGYPYCQINGTKKIRLVFFIDDTSVTSVADLQALLTNTNAQIVYPLATPITLAITSQDIPTLLGENNIFSNCGDVEVNYYTSKSNDILEFIDSEIGKKNGTNIPIEANSQDSIKDYVDNEVSNINLEIGKKNGTNIPIEANSQDSIKDYIDNEVSTITTSLSGKADKTEDATITVASGYSLISSSCGKTDRLVHLNFNVEKSGGFSTGWQVIGTTEFKPNTLAYCPLWNVTNGVGNGEVRIDTDGTINFYIVTAGELRLNANIGYITD